MEIYLKQIYIRLIMLKNERILSGHVSYLF